MEEGQIFCNDCGYPQNGTEDQKSSFHAKRVMKRRQGDEAQKRIRFARNSLYVIAGFSFLYGLFHFFVNDDMATLVSSGILAIIYLALGYWSQQKPLIALVLGLLVYLTLITIGVVLGGEPIYRGIIIKVIIIAYLAKGINSALQLRNLK
jgi:hypothetical protein